MVMSHEVKVDKVKKFYDESFLNQILQHSFCLFRFDFIHSSKGSKLQGLMLREIQHM